MRVNLHKIILYKYYTVTLIINLFKNHRTINNYSYLDCLLQVEVLCLPEDIFWRKPLLDDFCSSKVYYPCNINAPPQPPTLLENIEINETAYFLFESTLRVTITWELPIFPNGVLLHHQLRIGTIPISPQENTLESSTVFEETEIKVLYF